MGVRVEVVGLFVGSQVRNSSTAINKQINRVIEKLEKAGHKIIGPVPNPYIEYDHSGVTSGHVLITYEVDPNFLGKLRKSKKTPKEARNGKAGQRT